MIQPLDDNTDEGTRALHGEILSAFANLEYLDRNFDLGLKYALQLLNVEIRIH